MKITATNFALFLLFVLPAHAQQEKPEFKGFYFGETTYQEWRSKVHETGEIYGKHETIAPYCKEDGAHGYFDDPEIGIKNCSWYNPSYLFDNIPVGQAATNSDSWVFLDDVLVSFSASLYIAQLQNLLRPLNAKYGPPNDVLTETLTNAFGAEFTNEIHIWVLPEMTITVSKYAGTIDTSMILISNPGLNEEQQSRKNSLEEDVSGL